MSLKRIVDTNFWSDEKVVEMFSPEDKLFFLYLLTNPHSTLLGIYPIARKTMAFELGYSAEAISVLLDRFENKYGIIKCSDETNEIAIKNYLKYSIVKGGTPIKNCLQRDIKAVKDKRLIDFVFSSIEGNEGLICTISEVIAEWKGQRRKSNQKEENNNSYGYGNGYGNGNGVSYPDSYHDSYHDSYPDSYHDSCEGADDTRQAPNGYSFESPKSKQSGQAESPAQFVKPTVEEIRAYCDERGNTIDAEYFHSYYECRGWMLGNSPMVDWKACVNAWEKRERKTSQAQRVSTTQPSNSSFDEDEMFLAALARGQKLIEECEEQGRRQAQEEAEREAEKQRRREQQQKLNIRG